MSYYRSSFQVVFFKQLHLKSRSVFRFHLQKCPIYFAAYSCAVVIYILLDAQHKALGRSKVYLLILDQEAGGECAGSNP